MNLVCPARFERATYTLTRAQAYFLQASLHGRFEPLNPKTCHGLNPTQSSPCRDNKKPPEGGHLIHQY